MDCVIYFEGESHYQSTKFLELTKFLLKHDKGVVSTPLGNGDLPLHIACNFQFRRPCSVIVVELLYNAFPGAICMENIDGKSPLRLEGESQESMGIAEFFRKQLDMMVQAMIDNKPDEDGLLPIHRALSRSYDKPAAGTVQLMAKANPRALHLMDKRGFTPLHISCRFDDIAKASEDSLLIRDAKGNLSLHISCLEVGYRVMSYILGTSKRQLTELNNEGKLPIELLLYQAVCNRDRLEYVQAVNKLLRANPESLTHLLVLEGRPKALMRMRPS
jgi:hypothetical protein